MTDADPGAKWGHKEYPISFAGLLIGKQEKAHPFFPVSSINRSQQNQPDGEGDAEGVGGQVAVAEGVAWGGVAVV